MERAAWMDVLSPTQRNHIKGRIILNKKRLQVYTECPGMRVGALVTVEKSATWVMRTTPRRVSGGKP